MRTRNNLQEGRLRRATAVAGLVALQTGAALALANAAQAAPATERVSINSARLQANGTSTSPSVNGDGNYIAFSSLASNLANMSTGQVYVRDKIRGATEIASMGNLGLPNGRSVAPSISENGRFVAFQSAASNLVSGDTNGRDDIFVKDRLTGAVSRVSVSTAGAQGNGISADPQISGNGVYVVYTSLATNLVAGDTNNATDVFLHDRVNKTTVRLSVGISGVQGNRNSQNPTISFDGSKIAFESAATNLITADTNGFFDIFVANRQRVQFRVSQSSAGTQADNTSFNPAMAGNGSAVAYESRATNLVDGDHNSRSDIFHTTLSTPSGGRLTVRASNGASSLPFNNPANGNSVAPWISASGRVVAYSSTATNLVFNDTNGATQDVYVANLDRPVGAQNTLVSVSTSGAAGNNTSAQAGLSTNGLVAAYASHATNLVSGDTNGAMDVFARILQ